MLKQNGMKERQLYDYQLDMKRRVGEAFGSHRSVMVQMPTGTGKTCVLVACVRAWLSQNEGTVWIVVHRRELVEQIVGTLQEEDLVGDRVRAFSIQWLSRHEGELAERPGLLVIDEAHHAVAKTYKAVVEACPGAKVLGDYVQKQIDSNRDYRPQELPKLESAVIQQRENTVLLLVAGDLEAAQGVLEQ